MRRAKIGDTDATPALVSALVRSRGRGAHLKTDPRAILPRLERLYTPAVSDALDRLGIRDKVMEPTIRPLYPQAKLAGIAATVLVHHVYAVPAEPFLLHLGAIDRLQPEEVLVVSTGDGCFLGELIATAIRARHARGIVLDCWLRDAQRIIDMQLPSFVRGLSPLDALGRLDVTATQVPIRSGGVLVAPGDFLLADFDGVVVVPRAVADDVVANAEEKADAEGKVRAALERGESLVATYRKYQVI